MNWHIKKVYLILARNHIFAPWIKERMHFARIRTEEQYINYFESKVNSMVGYGSVRNLSKEYSFYRNINVL